MPHSPTGHSITGATYSSRSIPAFDWLKFPPTDHQTLFHFAIARAASVIGEFGGGDDYWHLRAWAKKYASESGLTAPENLEAYGIYCEPDEDQVKELRVRGIEV